MNDPVAAPTTALLPALAACAGPFAWMQSLDQPLLRSTGLAAFLCFVASAALAVHAFLRDRRLLVRALLLLPTFVIVAFSHLMIVQLRLPASPAFASLEKLAFTLPDQDGKPFTVPDPHAKGDTLVVFFRGHW